MSLDVPTEDERLDFLRQAIVFSDWNIRSLDTKAQISIVAFALSLSPLWAILSSACPRAASSLVVAVLILMLVTTVLLFAFVLWPVTTARPTPSSGWPRKGLFSAGEPNQIATGLQAGRFEHLAIEADLVVETLNLARIREIKNRRFKHALRSVFVFYVWAMATFLLLRNC
jgi:hypothetical protein